MRMGTASGRALGWKYGKLLDGIRDVQLPTVDGAMIPAPALSLPVLVQAKADSCPLFRENLVGAMLARKNELRLILYLDEVIVGNPLRPDPSRKAMIAYTTFLDFQSLHDESLWLTVGLVRHDDMHACVGRCPAVVRRWLQVLREDTNSGFPVAIEGNIVRWCSFQQLFYSEMLINCGTLRVGRDPWA